MTARNTRVIGLMAAGALTMGVVAIPPSFADPRDSSGSSGSSGSGPSFYQVGASDLPAGSSSVRIATKVAKSKNPQVLQSFNGGNDIGADGIGVAAGPDHVVQITPNGVNLFDKATGAGKTRSLNAQFGLDVSIEISDPTVEYDPIGNRWITAAVTDDGGDLGLVVRVSKKSAPNKWYPSVSYASSTSTGEINPDVDESQVRIGVTADKVVLTAAADDPNDATVANRILFIPKPALFKGNTPDAWISDLNSTYNGQSPAVNASKQPNAFVSVPATTDVTVTTYRGKATGNPPTFSKSVMYPNTNLSTPPTIDQGSGDDLDVGPLTFDAVWRSGKLFAVATSNCAGDACVRVFGIGTNNGVNLTSQSTIKGSGTDFFTPSVAIDGAGNVHVASTFVNSLADVGERGPDFVVRTLKASNSKWTKSRTIATGSDDYIGLGDPTDWIGGTAAALDPTAPWDAWVTGAYGVAGGDLQSKVARVSLAKNIASLKVSSKRVAKGKKVTFTAKLTRPGGDTIKGLPIALQKKGKNWSTIGSKKTNAKGKAQWTLKIKKAAQYRTYGKGVKQNDGQGRVFDKVYSKPVKISLK